jgi:hypothetical protein
VKYVTGDLVEKSDKLILGIEVVTSVNIKNSSACSLLQAGFLLALLFDPENEDGVCFQRTTRLCVAEDRCLNVLLLFALFMKCMKGAHRSLF